MKNKKKMLMCVLSAFLVLSLLAACGGKTDSNKQAEGSGNTTTSEGTKTEEAAPASDKYELGKEPLEFTFYGHYDWYTMPTWGQDESTKWIKENKKVDIKAIQSGGAAAQKLNTMIATNELPDVIWMDRGPDVDKLRQADMLVPFDDYLDKYPNLKTWFAENGMNMLRSDDGKLYQFPNWYTSQPNGNAGYVVNKKIYTELGSPKIETTEDLYNYLKQVKAKYPDVTPFETGLAKDGQGLDILYSAFKANNKGFSAKGVMAVPTDGKLTSIFKDEPYRQSMVYASKLFREKLITQDAMTQTKDQEKEKVMTGRVAVYATSSPTDIAQLAQPDLAKKDPNGGYIMIPPVHAEGVPADQVFPGSYKQLGWNVSVITKAAKNPEAIFAFLDWYTGPEGQSVQMWGPEGKYWQGLESDGITPKFTDAYVTEADALAKLQGETVNLMWNGNTVFLDKTKAKYEATLPLEKRSWATHWQSTVTWKTQSDATEFVNLTPMPESEEGIALQRINDIFVESRAKALFAKNDAEVLAILDKAAADADTAGFPKLLEFETNKWQENLKKMNGGK